MDTRQSYYFPSRVLPPQTSLHVRFYFPGILVGPYIDFPEYMELINETPFRNAQVKARAKHSRRLPPGRVRAAYTKLSFGLVYLAAFVLMLRRLQVIIALTQSFDNRKKYIVEVVVKIGVHRQS